jgi:hypothetical protein
MKARASLFERLQKVTSYQPWGGVLKSFDG